MPVAVAVAVGVALGRVAGLERGGRRRRGCPSKDEDAGKEAGACCGGTIHGATSFFSADMSPVAGCERERAAEWAYASKRRLPDASPLVASHAKYSRVYFT